MQENMMQESAMQESAMQEVEYPISLDTALQIVGSLKIKAIKSESNNLSKDELNSIKEKIQIYNAEERLLYEGNDLVRLSIMDKIIKLYSPQIKKMNGY